MNTITHYEEINSTSYCLTHYFDTKECYEIVKEASQQYWEKSTKSHGRENHHWLEEWFREINALAILYPNLKFVLPIHPNPNVQKCKHLLHNVNVIEPLTHDETIKLLRDCKLVITDSGGLQEEGSFFNKKVIVCRKTTERPEGIQTGHLYMCEEPKKLRELFGELDQMTLPPCHYGFQVYTRELSNEEKYNIWFNKNYETGMERYFDPNNLPDFDNEYYAPIPKRAISLMWNQRSVDTFLGLPFNIASYGLLLEIIAKEVNMVPDQLIGNLGDVHLYNNHIEQAKEQIDREPFELPKLGIVNGPKRVEPYWCDS